MKLLLDQGLPRSAADLLRHAGIETIHVAEIGMSSAEDADIIRHGLEQQSVIVTLDADFHALLALSGASAPSVIRLRVEGLRAAQLVTLLEQLIEQFDEDLEQGSLLTVQQTRVRVRRLPLLP